MKSVCDYSSCQEYLRSAFKNAKQGNSKLTLQTYAQKLGIGHSTLKMVLSGKRRLTLVHVHQIANKLKLSDSELEYFEALALKERTKQPTELRLYSRRVKRARAAAKLHSVLLSKKELLSDPYTLPILVYLTDSMKITPDSFQLSESDISAISSKFSLSRGRVKQALDVIESVRLEIGAKKPVEVHYVFDKLVGLISQKQYLKNWLAEAALRIDSDYSNPETFFNSSTISISKENLASLNQELRTVLQNYMCISEQANDPSTIAQVCIQLFPLSGFSRSS